MSNSVKEEIVVELINNVLETKFEKFSQEDVDNAQDRVIDVIGCAIGGAYASGNSALLDVVRGLGGSQEATILVHGDKLPSCYAAMINSIMCRSYDYEACGPEARGKAFARMPGHVCGTTDTTALTVAEATALGGKDVIAAVILGGDLAVRMAITEDFSWEHSFDITGTVNAFGAAAIAGRLWGLDNDQMKNAFGILVNLVAGSFQSIFDGVHTFKFHQGVAAYNGIFSVELARRGFTSIKDPFFSPHGYFEQYTRSYDPEFLTENLGKEFYSKGNHKFIPSCFGNHAPIEGCLELLRQHEINSDEIAEVRLVVPENMGRFLTQPFEPGDSEEKALFVLPYGVANVLLRKSTKIEHYTAEFVADPKVIELARKVKLLPASTRTQVQGMPTDSGVSGGFDLMIKMKDGQKFELHIDKPPRGVGPRPLSRDEIRNKFWHNLEHTRAIPRKNAKDALAMFEKLEEVDDISKLMKLLTT